MAATAPDRMSQNGTAPLEVPLAAATARFTPNELMMIKEHYGRTFTQIAADDNSDDRLVVLAWLKLRRDGLTLSLDEMGEVIIDTMPAAPDPTSEPDSEGSPASATFGE